MYRWFQYNGGFLFQALVYVVKQPQIKKLVRSIIKDAGKHSLVLDLSVSPATTRGMLDISYKVNI